MGDQIVISRPMISGNTVTKAPDNSHDAVLARMLKTPPKPFTPKAKPKASPKQPKKA